LQHVSEAGLEIAMRVMIKSGDADVENIGDFATYGEALTIALEVFRRLETLPRPNRAQLVEIHDADDMRLRAEVSHSHRKSLQL